MKFRIQFKDPDCHVTGLGDAVEFVDQLPEKARDVADSFLEFSEYVTIEFDTSDGTAKVLLNE